METTQTYKGYKIKVINDVSPENPFEAWDCEPSLMVEYDRNSNDYSKGEIDRYLTCFLSDNQILRHQKKLFNLLSFTAEDFSDLPTDEKLSSLHDELERFIEENIENKVAFCELFKIKHYSATSRGYSQGDWAEVFVIMTDKDREKLGTPKKLDDVVLKGAFKLYGYWAWGDVYGYQVEYKGGEELDSCWGYYGDDHEESGLMEAAKNAIDCHISGRIKEHCKKVKTYIKNNVPLNKRQTLIF